MGWGRSEDRRALPTGVYLCRMQAAGFSQTRRLMLTWQGLRRRVLVADRRPAVRSGRRVSHEMGGRAPRKADVSWPDLMRDLDEVRAVELTLDGVRYRLRTDLHGNDHHAFAAAGVRPPTLVTPRVGPGPPLPVGTDM